MWHTPCSRGCYCGSWPSTVLSMSRTVLRSHAAKCAATASSTGCAASWLTSPKWLASRTWREKRGGGRGGGGGGGEGGLCISTEWRTRGCTPLAASISRACSGGRRTVGLLQGAPGGSAQLAHHCDR